MNEEYIKKIIAFKFNAADKLINHFGDDISKKVKSFIKLIYNAVEENINVTQQQQKVNEASSSKKVNSIIIE